MVGYVGFLCPIVLPVPRLSCKTLFRVGSRGLQAGGCRTTGPYGSRRGGSKYAPSHTLLFQHAAVLLMHINMIPQLFVVREEKSAPGRPARGGVVFVVVPPPLPPLGSVLNGLSTFVPCLSGIHILPEALRDGPFSEAIPQECPDDIV